MVLLIHQIIIEVLQVFDELSNDSEYWKKSTNWSPLAFFTSKHFKQSSNWIDLMSLCSNVMVLWMIQMDVNMVKVRILASVATVCIWMQLIFWFRLSDALAQHVDLILSTVEDIVGFIIILITSLMMLASGFYMLQINRLLPNSQD